MSSARLIIHRLAVTSVAVAISVGLFAFTPSTTLAWTSPFTCSGNGCNGSSPYLTKCSWTSVQMAPGVYNRVDILETVAIGSVGRVSFVFSEGCQTAWAYVTNLVSQQAWFATGIWRNDQYFPPIYDYLYAGHPCLPTNGFCLNHVGSGYTSYGDQVYDGGSYYAKAVGYYCGAGTSPACYSARGDTSYH